MSLQFHLLPERTGGAAENMALDFLLLQRYPHAGEIRFRHYNWRNPAFTFGYSQKLAFVQAQLPKDETFDLCRRPTGGGVVDHRDDWTYGLAIPRGHALWDARATESYRIVHECIASTLRAMGCPATLQSQPPGLGVGETGIPGPGVCFTRAELFDVIDSNNGDKIAGAAQKRNKHGLLFQGSIWKPAAGSKIDWDSVGDAFTTALARATGSEKTEVPWPDLDESECEALVEQYATPEWNAAR
jgi:lipoyl(octanoyl) transferase